MRINQVVEKLASDDVPYIETEAYELALPGRLIGKAVIDSRQKMVGIVRNLKIRIPPGDVYLLIKGLDVEVSVPQEAVVAVGGVVQLKRPLNQAEEIDMTHALRLRDELREEIEILMNNFKRRK